MVERPCFVECFRTDGQQLGLDFSLLTGMVLRFANYTENMIGGTDRLTISFGPHLKFLVSPNVHS